LFGRSGRGYESAREKEKEELEERRKKVIEI